MTTQSALLRESILEFCARPTRRPAACLLLVLVVLVVLPWSPGLSRLASSHVELEEAGGHRLERLDGAQARYQHAETVMKSALEQAHDYEHRAAKQTQLEKKDETMHYELVKAARDRADELRKQDRKVSKVSNVRIRWVNRWLDVLSVSVYPFLCLPGCVCFHVCVRVCVRMYTYTYVYIYVCVYVCKYIHIHTHKYIHVYIYTHT